MTNKEMTTNQNMIKTMSIEIQINKVITKIIHTLAIITIQVNMRAGRNLT